MAFAVLLAGCRHEAAPAPRAVDAALAVAGAPCGTDGASTCSEGRGEALRCLAGRLVLVSTCRGPAGCVPLPDGARVACDDSLAEEGDPCDTPRQPACSKDLASELFCRDGGYAKTRACIKPCAVLDGGVRCE